MIWTLYFVGLILIGCSDQRALAPDQEPSPYASPVEVSGTPTSNPTGTPTPEPTPTSTPDADGWSVAEGDCNDLDWQIHPDAYDVVCDGVDQNCNGQVDEGITSYVFWDYDSDRKPLYGPPVMAGCIVEAQEDQVLVGTWPVSVDWDCDDNDPTILGEPCPL